MTDHLLGPGLPNMGNTCYIASIIQCLRFSRKIVAQLQKHDTSKDTPLVRSLVELLYSSSTKQMYNLFVRSLAASNREFQLLRQCDAHELYLFLIDTLYTEHKKYNNLFSGQLQSTVTCCECNYSSITMYPFISLSLEMSTKPFQSVPELLEQFFRTESLEDKIDCERCKTKQQSTKNLQVSNSPPLLAIHLKRFMGMMKNNAEIELSKNIQVRNSAYELYAVCNHSGSLHGGHYTAACKKKNKTWVLCNDNFISELYTMPVRSAEPYILFYVRV